MKYQQNVHLYGCDLASCTGCVAEETPEIAALAASVVESRAALVARGKAIPVKTFELDEREES